MPPKGHLAFRERGWKISGGNWAWKLHRWRDYIFPKVRPCMQTRRSLANLYPRRVGKQSEWQMVKVPIPIRKKFNFALIASKAKFNDFWKKWPQRSALGNKQFIFQKRWFLVCEAKIVHAFVIFAIFWHFYSKIFFWS